MSTDNSLMTYQYLTNFLSQQKIALTGAEMHGLMSGIICGGSQDRSWNTLLCDLTNEGLSFSVTLSEQLQQLYDDVKNRLREEDFAFRLLLPDDESSVFERADALAGWVNHFLLGLGVTQPKLGHLKGEIQEVINDLRNIAQLGYDEGENQEELEQSLEEVIEYVRMAAMLCYSEFNQNDDADSKGFPPTLH